MPIFPVPPRSASWPDATPPRRRPPRPPLPGERRIETEHYVYLAMRPPSGRDWLLRITPVSAPARYHAQAMASDAYTEPGVSLASCPFEGLGAYIARNEAALYAYWGAELHADWREQGATPASRGATQPRRTAPPRGS